MELNRPSPWKGIHLPFSRALERVFDLIWSGVELDWRIAIALVVLSVP